MIETEVTFFNRGGTRLAAVMTLPEGASRTSPAPAVLLCQGLSGVKGLVLPEIAAGFATRGLASLRFDYAGCGESEGTPGWIDPGARVDDALYAFAWLCSQPSVAVDRVGVYGHSYGGPVAISLASLEPRARAVVSVSGPGDGEDMLRAVRPSWDWIAFKARLREERANVAVTGDAQRVDLSEIYSFSPAFLAAYQALKAEGGSSAMTAATADEAVTFFLTTADAMLAFRPSDAARHLGGRPLLLVQGEDDDTVPVETVEPVYANAPGPKRWVRIPGAAHNDLDAGPGLAHAIGLAADWFTQHLA